MLRALICGAFHPNPYVFDVWPTKVCFIGHVCVCVCVCMCFFSKCFTWLTDQESHISLHHSHHLSLVFKRNLYVENLAFYFHQQEKFCGNRWYLYGSLVSCERITIFIIMSFIEFVLIIVVSFRVFSHWKITHDTHTAGLRSVRDITSITNH